MHYLPKSSEAPVAMSGFPRFHREPLVEGDADHDTIVPSVEESVSRGKRDRCLNVVRTLKDGQNLHEFLEWKVELAVRGVKSSSAKIIRS